jgi:hypothetical protein
VFADIYRNLQTIFPFNYAGKQATQLNRKFRIEIPKDLDHVTKLVTATARVVLILWILQPSLITTPHKSTATQIIDIVVVTTPTREQTKIETAQELREPAMAKHM